MYHRINPKLSVKGPSITDLTRNLPRHCEEKIHKVTAFASQCNRDGKNALCCHLRGLPKPPDETSPPPTKKKEVSKILKWASIGTVSSATLESSETQGGVYMDFSESIQSLMNWSEVTKMRRTVSFEKY